MAAYIGFQPKDQFGILSYSGNGSTQSITGLGFQPDFVWVFAETQVVQELCIIV